MKTNLETKKETVLNAMDHYTECVMTLSKSIEKIQDTQLQKELGNTVKAVAALQSAFINHRDAMFEEHGWSKVTQ